MLVWLRATPRIMSDSKLFWSKDYGKQMMFVNDCSTDGKHDDNEGSFPSLHAPRFPEFSG